MACPSLCSSRHVERYALLTIHSTTITDLYLAFHTMPAATRCPPDVLFEIFSEAIHEEESRPSRCAPPINVSQTCRSWRYAALSFPQLWSILNMDASRIPEDESRQARCITTLEQKFENALQTWLDRSRNASLRYSWTEDRPHDKVSFLLLDHQARWERIYISWNRDRVKPPVLEVTDLRRLESLSIDYTTSKYQEPTAYVNLTLQERQRAGNDPLFPDLSRPLIKFPHLSNPAHAIAPALTELTLNNLTGLPDTPRVVLIPILQHTPNLEILIVKFYLGTDIDYDETRGVYIDHTNQPARLDIERGPSVRLPCLRSLTYECFGAPYTNVLAHLRVPALKELRLGEDNWTSYNEDRWDTDDICEMLRESAAHVRSFVCFLDLDGGEWMALYESLPSLESLEFDHMHDPQPNGIVQAFEPSRLPNLKRIRGNIMGLFEEDDSFWGADDEANAEVIERIEHCLSRYFENGGSAIVDFDFPMSSGWRCDPTIREWIMKSETLRKMIDRGCLVLS